MMASNGSINRYMQREYWQTLPYFHDSFKSTDEVSHFIKKKSKGKAGTFLLRPSIRNRDLLTASVMVPDHTVRHTHIHIEPVGNSFQYFLVVEKKFDTIEELVSYYEQNPVKNLENVNNVFLRKGINRKDFKDNVYFTSHNGFTPSRASSTLTLSSRASSERLTQPPPLPTRPRTHSSNESSGVSFDSDSNSNSLSTGSISNRPPLPIPSSGEKNRDILYYSQARDVDEDMSEKLKDVLKSSERCDCGIPRHLAELPSGWTVHLSKDPLTKGKLFYQSEEGVTSWQLPQDIEMQLNMVHISNLRQIDKNWAVRRVINQWKQLPEEVVKAKTLNSFKKL